MALSAMAYHKMLLISIVRYLLQLKTLLVTSSASCQFCHLTARERERESYARRGVRCPPA